MKSRKRAVVAGLICLDIIPSLNNTPQGKFFELFQPGLMVQIGPPIFSTGGAVSNTGLAMHILGIETNLIGKVGDDMYGHAILDLLRNYSPALAEGMVVDLSVSSSYTIIISPPGIDRIFLHHPGANNRFGLSDMNFEVVKQAALFHFGYPPVMEQLYTQDGLQLTALFKQVKELGLTTSLDMCFPDPASAGGKADWTKILSKTLPYVDIFLPSIEELLYTIDRQTYQKLYQQSGSRFLNFITPELLHEISQTILDMGTRIVLIKLGARGAYLRTAGYNLITQIGYAQPKEPLDWCDQEIWAPCFKVDVVGTTGSGDATIAGFLAGLLLGQSPIEAITSAVAVGACNVEAADAISGLRTWEDTQARISAGWERQPLWLTSPGWSWDKTNQLWLGPKS